MDTEILLNELTIDKNSEDSDKITGKEWLKHSISLWDDVKTSEERQFGHPASFPVEMIKKIIRLYTKSNDTVLDPFMGIGSTLVAANWLNRKGIGLDINESYITIAYERLKSYSGNYKIINDTCLNLNNHVFPNSIDLCVTSPPYWDILNRKHTVDNKLVKNYSAMEEDIGNIDDYGLFLDCLKRTFLSIYNCLKPNKTCVIIVMDIRKRNRFYPLHMDIARIMGDIGYILEDFIIWDRRKEYNNLRPLGYPWVFRVNKVHEYICIFSKPGER